MSEQETPQLALMLKERPKNEIAEQKWNLSLRQSFLALPARTVNDIVKLRNPTPLVAIGKEYGEIQTAALMTVILNDLIDFFNVANSMNAIQVAYTIRLIRDEYYYFTIEDFKVCFDNAKKGRYGKLYGGIDGSVIMDWLGQYAAERIQAFTDHNDQKATSDKDRYECRGNTQKIAEIELRQIFGRDYKPSI